MKVGFDDEPFFRLFLILYLLIFLAACEGTTTQPPQEAGVVVTFPVVNGEEYKIRLADTVDIEIARKLLAGEEAPHIPGGLLFEGTRMSIGSIVGTLIRSPLNLPVSQPKYETVCLLMWRKALFPQIATVLGLRKWFRSMSKIP